MPKGFAHPYLLIAVMIIAGSGIAVYSASKSIEGLVLGTKTRNESVYQQRNNGITVTVVSPGSSWDLSEYLCAEKEECEKSQTGGKWLATVSGAPTSVNGHDVFIERSPKWDGFKYMKLMVKSGSSNTSYLYVEGTSDTVLLVDLEELGTGSRSVKFL